MKDERNISTIEAVERFLSELRAKMSVFGIVFLDERQKNTQTLRVLAVPSDRRLDIIRGLDATDYSEGPIADVFGYFGEMWVFGKDVNGREVYIKISLGRPNSNVICISFHISEHPMTYPYRK